MLHDSVNFRFRHVCLSIDHSDLSGHPAKYYRTHEGVISFKYYTESRLFFIAITAMEVRRWSCAHVEQMVHSTVLTEKRCTVQLFAGRDSLIAIFGKRSGASTDRFVYSSSYWARYNNVKDVTRSIAKRKISSTLTRHQRCFCLQRRLLGLQNISKYGGGVKKFKVESADFPIR